MGLLRRQPLRFNLSGDEIRVLQAPNNRHEMRASRTQTCIAHFRNCISMLFMFVFEMPLFPLEEEELPSARLRKMSRF